MYMNFINDFHKEFKRQDNRGRCLHYDKGGRCNKIISAHSIQNKGQLSLISESGHVYRFSADISILRKTNGIPLPEKIGVNRVSTFLGFCKHHDNDLFKPIDKYPLTQDKRQIALYAYRCLCREFFVKENAVELFKNIIEHPEIDDETRSFFSSSLLGNCTGLHGLQYHKALYDNALQVEDYDQFEFLYVTCSTCCNAQFSGLLYPDFDFEGNSLQDITDIHKVPSLITFFTAPIDDGWAFCFAWHVSSNDICIPFIQSLAYRVANGEKPEDIIFRFSLSCCENHAIRISWWDRLSEDAKNEVISRVGMMVHPELPIPANYLASGCEGIADWEFEHIYTTLKIGG